MIIELAVSVILTLPNHKWNPGMVSNNVTQDNIQRTICVPGYSKKARPSVSYTNKIKTMGMNRYGYDTHKMHDFELDHLISIELGGHPTDPRNLWPQAWNIKQGDEDLGAHTKDKLENELHKEVCTGKISLRDAQTEISTDWVKAYHKRFGGK